MIYFSRVLGKAKTTTAGVLLMLGYARQERLVLDSIIRFVLEKQRQ